MDYIMSASRTPIRCLALGLALSAALASGAAAHSLKAVEDKLASDEAYVQIVDQPAPPFVLKNTAGRPVRLADFRDQVVVLWFVYTRCPDVCPLHSDALASIQEQVNSTPMREQVRFVTITTDPRNDTAAVLDAYGPIHGLDPVNWTMLTGGADDPDATRALAERYGLKFTPAEDGYQMHGVVTHLIDKSGNLRARYHGLKFDPTNLIVHINALANDFH